MLNAIRALLLLTMSMLAFTSICHAEAPRFYVAGLGQPIKVTPTSPYNKEIAACQANKNCG